MSNLAGGFVAGVFAAAIVFVLVMGTKEMNAHRERWQGKHVAFKEDPSYKHGFVRRMVDKETVIVRYPIAGGGKYEAEYHIWELEIVK